MHSILPWPVPGTGCRCGGGVRKPVGSCGIPEVRPLSAGPLTLQGITGSQTAVEASLSRDPVYETVLPSGSIGAGQVQLSAAGERGPSDATLDWPGPDPTAGSQQYCDCFHHGNPGEARSSNFFSARLGDGNTRLELQLSLKRAEDRYARGALS